MLLPLLTVGLSPQRCGSVSSAVKVCLLSGADLSPQRCKGSVSSAVWWFNPTSGAFVRVPWERLTTVGPQYTASSFLPAQYWEI